MMDWKTFCYQAVRRHVDTLRPAVDATPPQHSAMLTSEVVAFAAVCCEMGITRIVESGRCRGYSTELLARTGLFDVVSVESRPLAKYDKRLERLGSPRLTLLTGNGSKIVPGQCNAMTAILLDGPKNMAGLDLVESSLGSSPLVGVHDLCRLQSDTKKANPGRLRAEKLGAFFTDDEAFIEAFGYLDFPSLDFRSMEKHTSFIHSTCVLGIINNTNKGG